MPRMTNFRSAAIATGNQIDDSAYDIVKKVSDAIAEVIAVADVLDQNVDFSELATVLGNLDSVSSAKLAELATADLVAMTEDLVKGNYLGNRKVDINLALNMTGITEELIENDPDAAEAIWTDPTKTVSYDSATALFVDGTSIPITFEFDGSPITVSTHANLLQQLARYDTLTAVAQVDTVNTITVADSTLYTITINNIEYSYTSDVDATLAEVLAGLVLEINVTQTNGTVPVTALAGADYITLTADVAGTAFTATVNAGMVISTTTANVVAGPTETPFLAKLEDTGLSAFPADVVGEFIRFYDIVGQNSNLERITLNAVSGAYKELNPVYYWAKTTSALQSLSMRAGDVIKLGNEIDNLINLADNIDQVLELQTRIGELVDTYTNGVANGDETLYNRLTELIEVHEVLSNITTVYANISSINTVSTNVADINTVATDLNLGLSSNVNRVGESIANVNTVGGSITNVNTVATNVTNVNSVATTIVPNIAEILLADDNAATATAQADIATAQADIATTKADTIIAIGGNQVAQTLAAGSSATAYYNTGTGKFTFGIPQGAKGDKGDSFEVNAVGLLSARNLYDGQNTGFSFLAIDQAEIYFKLSNTSGDWSVAAPFGKGETGNGIDNTTFTSTTAVSGLAGEAGETDTYTITYTDATVDTFIVTNGAIPTKLDLGLDQVDNTSDATKNSAIATLTNKTLTSPVINTPTGIVKADVGLGNVDNTSDADKPVSTLQAQAIAEKASQATTFTKDEVNALLASIEVKPTQAQLMAYN